MDFNQRLKQAIERGEQTRQTRGRAALERELTEEELRRMHSEYRLAISEHIEDGLRRLADHLPGFDFKTIVSDDGWGARLTRDDLNIVPGRPPESLYSRLEILIAPFTPAALLDVSIKGTVRNREVINRKHFQKLPQVDLETLKELIDQRILEFAELFSASR